MSKKVKRLVDVVEEVDRETRQFGICELFGLNFGNEFDASGVDTGKPIEHYVAGYKTPGPNTPKLDPNYVFPPEETKVILMGLENKDRMLLVGPSGVGKTSILEQIAARLNYNVIRINFDGGVSRQDLVGEWVVKNKETEFQYGILPLAFRMPGTIIVLDEWDTLSGDCSFVLQRPLEKSDGKLMLLENGGELIELHPSNVICATANTCGQGDSSGLYAHGTKIQNFSQINRFGLTIRMKYLDQDKEANMLFNRFGANDGLTMEECQKLVQVSDQIRNAFLNDQISVPVTPRDTINWAEKYLIMVKPVLSAKYAFVNRMVDTDALVVSQILQRAFPPDDF